MMSIENNRFRTICAVKTIEQRALNPLFCEQSSFFLAGRLQMAYFAWKNCKIGANWKDVVTTGQSNLLPKKFLRLQESRQQKACWHDWAQKARPPQAVLHSSHSLTTLLKRQKGWLRGMDFKDKSIKNKNMKTKFSNFLQYGIMAGANIKPNLNNERKLT